MDVTLNAQLQISKVERGSDQILVAKNVLGFGNGYNDGSQTLHRYSGFYQAILF
jgi:hypothetical protein